MKPGAELDTLIARKVMGLRVFEGAIVDPAGKVLGPLLSYSTDLTAAWEIVEKYDIMVIARPGAIHACPPQCWIPEFEESEFPGLAQGDTIPHSVCLLALLYKGVIKKEDMPVYEYRRPRTDPLSISSYKK